MCDERLIDKRNDTKPDVAASAVKRLVMYVVLKQGVYEHGIFGLFSNKDKAFDAAENLANNDTDSYHTWDVYELPVGEVCECESYQDGFMANDPIGSFVKSDT